MLAEMEETGIVLLVDFDHYDDEQDQQAQICFMGQTETGEAHRTEEVAEEVGKVSISDFEQYKKQMLEMMDKSQ